MISHFQINSQMLWSLVFTGVIPMISIESEEFGTSYHKDSSFSFLILSVLIELGDQHDCGCIVRNETIIIEIHGKWWYFFYAGVWVNHGVRSCDVFSLFVTSFWGLVFV